MTTLWVTRPRDAHARWRRAQTVGSDARGYSDKALAQYASIWSVFCAWMTSKSLTVITVKALDIVEFLDSLRGRSKLPNTPAPAASIRTRRMYGAELGLVFSKLLADGVREDNPMVSILNTMRVVTPTPRANVHLPPPGLRKYVMSWINEFSTNAFAQLDDHLLSQYCMGILMLDCGATPKEIQKLTIGSVRGHVIHFPGHRQISQRDIELAPDVQSVVHAWLSRRERMIALTEPAYRKVMRLPYARRQVFARYASNALASGVHVPRVRKSFLADAQTLFDDASSDSSGSILSSKLFVRVGERVRNQAAATNKRPALTMVPGVVLARVSDRLVYEAAAELLNRAPTHCAREYAKGPQTLRNACCAMMIEQEISDLDIQKLLGLGTNHTVNAVRKAMR